MRRTTMSVMAVVAMAGTTLAQVDPGRPQPSQPNQPGQNQPGQPGSPRQPGMPTKPGQPTTPGQPGMERPGQTGIETREQRQLSNAELDQFTRGWPQDHLEAVRTLAGKYGPPNEGTASMIIWNNPGNYKKIIVHRADAEHQFPAPHKDFLETVVAFKVPVEKISQLAEFDGSIVVNRTWGTISAMCDKEENNIAALNLAHAIIEDDRSVEDARSELARIAQAVKSGEKPALATTLNFQSQPNAADPDRPARALGTPEPRDMDMDKKDKDNKNKDKDFDKPGKDKDNKDKPLPPRNDPGTPRR